MLRPHEDMRNTLLEIDRLLPTDVLAATEVKIANQEDAEDQETKAFYIQDLSQIDKTFR